MGAYLEEVDHRGSNPILISIAEDGNDNTTQGFSSYPPSINETISPSIQMTKESFCLEKVQVLESSLVKHQKLRDFDEKSATVGVNKI